MSENTVVGIVIDPETSACIDEVWNWQTGQAYAQQGYIVVAACDDEHYMTKEDMQRLFDYERELFKDCYGTDVPFKSE